MYNPKTPLSATNFLPLPILAARSCLSLVPDCALAHSSHRTNYWYPDRVPALDTAKPRRALRRAGIGTRKGRYPVGVPALVLRRRLLREVHDVVVARGLEFGRSLELALGALGIVERLVLDRHLLRKGLGRVLEPQRQHPHDARAEVAVGRGHRRQLVGLRLLTPRLRLGLDALRQRLVVDLGLGLEDHAPVDESVARGEQLVSVQVRELVGASGLHRVRDALPASPLLLRGLAIVARLAAAHHGFVRRVRASEHPSRAR